MCKFIRIINDESYIEDLTSQGLYKYIPRKILLGLQKHIKPRVLCRYKSRRLDKDQGIGVGLCLNQEEISLDEYKSMVIDIINSLKQEGENEDLEYLIDDSSKLGLEDLKDIEDKCKVKIPFNKGYFAANTLECLKKICLIKNEEICEKEVFILSEDTKITEDLVLDLALSTRFISLYSEDKVFLQKIEIEILKQTGLALHITSDLNKCLDSFDFIINLKEDLEPSMLNRLKQRVVVDLSKRKCLAGVKGRSKTKNLVIDDLCFLNDNDIFSVEADHPLDEFLDTGLSSLFKNTNMEIERVGVGQKKVKLDQALLNKKVQEQVSCFKKTPK